jgi:type I restriction enzyme S subunit
VKNKHTPDIRFQGFTGDWEQRKLDKILIERKVKQKISKEVPLLAFAAGQGVIDRSERKTNNRDFLTKDSTKKTYLLTKYDDIVYNPSNLKYGAIDRNKHGQGVISPIYVTFETNEIPSFIELIVKSENFKQQALQYEEGTVTKRQSVKPENLLCLNIVLPNSKDEQTKIGNFFKQLDDTIALYQEEITILKQTKQGFLQKMFPKEGESVPEIRFPRFTGDWDQRKLGDLADFSKGNGYSKSDLTDEGKPVILYGRLYTKYETVIKSVDTFTIEKEKSVKSEGNEVIVPASGESSEEISRASVVSEPGIILGGDLNIIRPSNELDPVFLALTISNGKQQIELSKRAQGKSVVHLQNSDLKEVNLLVPKKEEQTKIGVFFKKLEDMIALHQRELEVLKETKKAFIQKLLV